MDVTLDLHRVGIEAVAGVHIADFTDGLAGDGGIVHHRLGGDLAADQAKVRGDHGLAGHTGIGVLGQAGIQDGVGNRVGYLVGVAIGDAFGGKQSFFHFYIPFSLRRNDHSK